MDARLRDDEIRARFSEDFNVLLAGQECPKKPSHAHVADRHLWFAVMCRALWGTTAGAALFDLVGQHLKHKDDRQCRRWADGESEPVQSVLWMLVASREGYRVVLWIAGHTGWCGEVREWQRKAALSDAFAMGLKNAGSDDGNRRKGGNESNVDPGIS